MKAEELRIGNLVSEGIGDVAVVFHVERDRINYVSEDFYEPIPLTEQWLIDFGFVKCSVSDAYDSHHLTIYKEDGSFWSDVITFGLEIKYAHQLQNLHFAITGQELEKK